MDLSRRAFERRLRWLPWAIVAPALLTVLVSIAVAWHREEAALEHTLSHTSRALALAIDREIGTLEGVAWTLAASDAIVADDLAPFHRLAVAASQRVGAWVVVIEHAAGGGSRQLLNSRVPTGAPLPGGRGLAQFDAWKDAAVTVSDLFVGPVSNLWVTAVTVPSARMRNGARLSVSVATGPERFQELVVAQGLPAGWTAGILDRAGRIVARIPDPQRWVGELAPEPTRSRSGDAEEGAFTVRTLEGRTATAVVSRSPVYGWRFAIAAPDAGRFATALEALLPMFGVAALAIGAAVAVARSVTRRMRRALEGLHGAAAELEAGRRFAWHATGLRDVDEIGRRLAGASHAAAERRDATPPR